MAERAPLAPVQLTVHSICVLLEFKELSANFQTLHITAHMPAQSGWLAPLMRENQPLQTKRQP
jgi:hypothetical protein